MAENVGKKFEERVREAFNKVADTTVTRLIDPQNGFAGVRNICDFIIYHYPNQYFIECKSVHGNTLSFTGNITDNQWDGLIKVDKVPGVIAGYLVWFIDHDTTLFVSATTLKRMQDSGKKSLNVRTYRDDTENEYNVIVGKKKRVFFDYDMENFIKEKQNGRDTNNRL